MLDDDGLKAGHGEFLKQGTGRAASVKAQPDWQFTARRFSN
ncbi:hypothetical protein RAN3_3366 [plant metagenome]|uniref:Uncharacterized protein n=1 Tax=plant metagenome TaxID=1297885 RepID=A0A484UIB0_9ZZZZ